MRYMVCAQGGVRPRGQRGLTRRAAGLTSGGGGLLRAAPLAGTEARQLGVGACIAGVLSRVLKPTNEDISKWGGVI